MVRPDRFFHIYLWNVEDREWVGLPSFPSIHVVRTPFFKQNSPTPTRKPDGRVPIPTWSGVRPLSPKYSWWTYPDHRLSRDSLWFWCLRRGDDHLSPTSRSNRTQDSQMTVIFFPDSQKTTGVDPVYVLPRSFSWVLTVTVTTEVLLFNLYGFSTPSSTFTGQSWFCVSVCSSLLVHPLVISSIYKYSVTMFLPESSRKVLVFSVF